MLLSPVGQSLESLDTPALLLDLDALDHNIALMAERIIHQGGKDWRPHAKAFKSPAIAHLLRQAGAIGVTVAKVSEAEIFAASGIADILIANIVVGPTKTARLAALQHSACVTATVDHPDQLPALAEAARAAGSTIPLLVDLDIGLHRTGVATTEAALALADRIAHTPGLQLAGLMGYEGHALAIPDPETKRSTIQAAIARLAEARAAFECAGLPCPIVSAAGSGSYEVTAGLPAVTELQAGGGIFGCMYYLELCRVTRHKPALFVLVSVISRPAPDRTILDAGRKAFSNHGAEPTIEGHPDCRIRMLSAEHTTIENPRDTEWKIGQKVKLIPGYSDLTFVLHDRVLGHRDGRVETAWPILGRGALQ
jgi:D-serine deaminase-like pyridoxal phosphate-dependent protein